MFLSGIDAKTRRAAPGFEYDLPVFGRTHETKPELAIIQLAFARTDVAADACVLSSVQCRVRTLSGKSATAIWPNINTAELLPENPSTLGVLVADSMGRAHRAARPITCSRG